MPRGSAGVERVRPVGPRRRRKPRAVRARRRTGAGSRTMLGLVALPVFVLDQLVKLYIVRHLTLFEQIDLVPHGSR